MRGCDTLPGMPPAAPHRLFASIVLAGAALGGCYQAHEHGRERDAGSDARRDAGRDAGIRDAGPSCFDRGCDPCDDPRPECDDCFACIL